MSGIGHTAVFMTVPAAAEGRSVTGVITPHRQADTGAAGRRSNLARIGLDPWNISDKDLDTAGGGG